MGLHRQLAIVRAWWPLVIASVLLAGGAAFLASSLMPKVYEAKATLIVGQSLSEVNPDYTQLLASQRLSATYASVATTRPLLDQVIKELGLRETSDEVAQRVRADAALDSTLLTITVQDADPVQAASIANALANRLVAASPALQGRQADVQESVDVDLRATQDQIASTQAEVETLNGLSKRTAAQEARLETLLARLVSLRSSYAVLLPFSTGSAYNLLSLVEPAVAPVEPIWPRTLLNTLLAALMGLLIALAIAFVAEYFNDTVKDSEDVQEVLGLPTVGSITRMKGARGRSEIYRLATLLYPRSRAAEAYRTLRTNVDFASVDAPIRTLLVTSALPAEGKTVTAANLAVAFAQAGLRVLVADADFRRPGIHAIFDLPNTQGLTTLLRSDDASLEAIAYPTEQERLQVLTSGPLPPNPAELLGSVRMRTILDRLQAAHDLIIFDSPPLELVADSAILSSFMDGTLLVVDARHSHRGAVRKGQEALAKAGARVLGAVLNRLPERAHSDYYRDYYNALEQAEKRAQGPEKSLKGSA